MKRLGREIAISKLPGLEAQSGSHDLPVSAEVTQLGVAEEEVE